MTLIRNIVTIIGWINLAVDKEQKLDVVHTVTNLTNTIKCGVCMCVHFVMLHVRFVNVERRVDCIQRSFLVYIP